MTHNIIHIDFETFSEAALDEVGVTFYSKHHSTGVRCAAYKINNDAIRMWSPDCDRPVELLDAIEDGAYIVAHNAAFERAIANNIMCPQYGWPEFSLEFMVDTMALAAHNSLPQGLDDCARVLGLSETKDQAGYDLMIRTCQPGKEGKIPELTHDELCRLKSYCKQDVAVEVALFERLPKLSTPWLPLLWQRHVEICERGFPVDLPFVDTLLSMVEISKGYYGDLATKATGGEIQRKDLTRVAFLRQWLAKKGFPTTSLDKGVVTGLLADKATPPEVRIVLEARAQNSKSSTAKFQRIKDMALAGRVHDGYSFHGCITGRFAGRGVQPQNLPRNSDDIDHYARAVELNDFDALTFASNGRLMSALSECVRPCIKAPPFKTFAVADYAAIEARGVLWWSKCQIGQKIFADYDAGAGPEPYCWMAEKITGHPVTKKDKDDRAIGKQLILGAGYGMGGKRVWDKKTSEWKDSKFKATCAKYNIKISDELAEKCIYEHYRGTFTEVASSWFEAERTARKALGAPGLWHHIPGVVDTAYRFDTKRGWLQCQLPSGRLLTYHQAGLGQMTYTDEDGYTETKEGVVYYRWSNTYGWTKALIYAGHFVENIVQGFCADLLFGAMLRLDQNEFPVVLHSHDEIVAEVDDDANENVLKKYIYLLTRVPEWADGLPLRAEGWIGKRYKKM